MCSAQILEIQKSLSIVNIIGTIQKRSLYGGVHFREMTHDLLWNEEKLLKHVYLPQGFLEVKIIGRGGVESFSEFLKIF